jgi:hypothetical protein
MHTRIPILLRRLGRLLVLAAPLGIQACLEPIGGAPGSESGSTPAPRSTTAKRPTGLRPSAWVAATFFDEDFPQGGFTYTYGGTTTVRSTEGDGADSSEYFVRADLDPKEYSGAALCLWNQSFDLRPYLKTGALVFQARTRTGAGRFQVGLVDDEKSDGWKGAVRVDASKYGELKKGEWTTFVVPLRDFGRKGMAWDAARGVEKPVNFQWDLVQEFRILSSKGDNSELEVDLDEIRIWADAVLPESTPRDTVDWTDVEKDGDAPRASDLKLPDEVAGTFFDDDFPEGGFAYNYGGRSANKVLPSSVPGNASTWALYLDNDYSGATISLPAGRFMDLSAWRRTGSISFWIKPGADARKFYVGLLDDQGGERKVQTKVIGSDWAVLKTGAWNLCRIPLKAFSDDGTWWNSAQKHEIGEKIDWKRIHEFRISIGRDENKPAPGKPVEFHLDRIQATKTATGLWDPDAFWDGFRSEAPDQPVLDFTRWGDKWQAVHGSSAGIAVSTVSVQGAPPEVAGKALKIDFRPGDWYEALLKLPDAAGAASDWSRHYALSFWMRADKPFQLVDVTLQDRDHEYFTARVGVPRGWHRVVLPFRNFAKFAYYQPPEAVANNRLDLDGVHQIGFKPGGDVAGSLQIASIGLTNLREAPREKVEPVLPAVFRGDLSRVVQPVPPIHGANLENWMSEALDPVAVERVRALKLQSMRYPGGLHSDEEDWKKTLAAKDPRIDTDEFLEWCAKLGMEPMITANVGTGTPELAADWVRHCNLERKAGPKVRLWELGNELYGDWNHYWEKWGKDGGTAYGKRAREFILAMKAVDPSIKITVVWMLGGDWNRKVFAEVADLVDGVNVHHYAQFSGTESDEGLLAVSSEADLLMKDVRRQVDELGAKGHKYDIWLTEWNSVDFNPGPQILSQTEALFIADYLGHLAQSPIQYANVWGDVHNGREVRRGDYGLLAATNDPDGTHARRPAYWAVKMASEALRGNLLEGKTDREPLSGWMARSAEGKPSFLFVNKSRSTDFRTTLQVPGLSGEAEISLLDSTNCGEGPGPSTRVARLRSGEVLVVPRASVVEVRFR